jgi:hypothetical protein
VKELERPVTGRVQMMTAPATKYWELRAELRRLVQAGEIRQAWGLEQRGTECIVFVERIADPSPKAPWYVGITVTVLGALVGVGVMLWHARYVILAVLAIVAMAVLGTFLVHLSAGKAGCNCPVCGIRLHK